MSQLLYGGQITSLDWCRPSFPSRCACHSFLAATPSSKLSGREDGANTYGDSKGHGREVCVKLLSSGTCGNIVIWDLHMVCGGSNHALKGTHQAEVVSTKTIQVKSDLSNCTFGTSVRWHPTLTCTYVYHFRSAKDFLVYYRCSPD